MSSAPIPDIRGYLPELIILFWACTTLLLDLILRRQQKLAIAAFSFVGVLLALLSCIPLTGTTLTTFSGMYALDAFSLFFKVLFLLVAALTRHRSDPVRRARAALAGGPLSAWLIDHVGGLAAAAGRAVSADAVGALPELAIPPELAELLAVDAHTFVRRLLPRFHSGELGPAHRAVLTNLLARCRREVLLDAAAALETIGTTLSLPLAELCRLRDTMLAEL